MTDFRHDISTLRAVAITGVLLFHYRFGSTGGFAGVDVFFVVSGFLMSGIIWGRLGTGRFSLLEFYGARIRRIVPALAVLCAALFAFGLVLIDPVSLDELGRETVSALLFYSNFQFWQEAGYFDGAGSTKLLLHSWSLSVEWQFYIVYPLVLLALHRLAPRHARHLILAGAVLSFGLAVVIATRKPDFAFYLLPTRAWEMALGGLPVFYGVRLPARWRPAVAYGGLGAIVLSLALVDASMPWPAWATLAPTLATAAVITADHRDGRLFRLPIVGTVGAWSYSIYLWHWPVLVVLAYFDVTSLPARIAAVGLVLILAGLSFTFVERTGLRWLTLRRPRLALAAATGLVAIAGASAAAAYAGGFPGRFGGDPARIAALRAASSDWDDPVACGGMNVRARKLPDCTLGHGPRKVMLFGDSYAEQLYPRMAELVKRDPNLTVHMVTNGGCPPMPGVSIIRPGATCTLFNRVATDEALSGHYDVVVIASIWAPYFQTDHISSGVGAICFEAGNRCSRPAEKAALLAEFQAGFDRLAASIEALQTKGVTVILVLPTPFPAEGTRDIPSDTVRRAFLRLDTADMRTIELGDFRQRTAYVSGRLADVAARTGAVLYDPAPSLCPDGHCPVLDADGIPLYMDSAHLRSSVIAAAPLHGLDAAITAATASR